MSVPFKAGFGNLAKPDFTYLHSGNSAEKFPPAGGMGDWGKPQQARLSYKLKEKKIKREKNPSVIFKGADNTPYEKIGDEVRSLADEVPFDIPDSWEWVRIRSLGEIVRGSGIKRNETVQQGLPCVRYGELYTTYQTSLTSAVSFIAPDLYEKCKHFSYGDVLMTLTGENKPDIVQQLFLSVHPDTPVRLIFSMIPYLGVWSQRNRRFSAGKFYAFRAALWRG